jgi:DNA-directed RNA polymerase specialized sigma24 family protein
MPDGLGAADSHEIGRALGMKPATVRVQLHRARAKVAEEVGPELTQSPAAPPA